LEQEKVSLPEYDITVLEESPYKLSLLIKKEQSQELLKDILSQYNLNDITIEEEDIGTVVERIYSDKGEIA
jgi:ABC-2 type transport system ATP-binding protein